MPSQSAAKKTALAPKKILVGALVAAVIIIIGSFIWLKLDAPKLQIAGHTYDLDVASTLAQQERGLGGRASMTASQGMLFTYTSPGKYCYWMKDMQFPLDIIWTDSDKRVIKIEQSLSPQTYPKTYCPASPDAEYVIELHAGQTAATHMYLGEQLRF